MPMRSPILAPKVRYSEGTFRLATALVVCAVGCSSPPPSVSTPIKPAAEDRRSAESTAVKSVEKPKKEAKYPSPFLEPDCGTVPADGYLEGAKAHIAEVRKAHWSQLEKCMAEVEDGMSVHGEVRTSFRIDTDGIPRCVEGSASSVPTEVVNCIVYVYRSFRFKPPKRGSVRVSDGVSLDVHEVDE